MKAVVYRGRDDLRVESIPVPRIGRDELLVRVAACGVCPTDIKKIAAGDIEPPRVFGHETSGTIVKVGNGVRGFREGQRVALHHHVPCLNCHFCRHSSFAQCPQYKRTGVTAGFEAAGGGYAEFVRVLQFALPGVVRIPARNDFFEGAMLEPVNTVLKGVRRLGVLRGDTVLVVGLGPIGLMFTRLLVLKGVRVIGSDLVPWRLKMGLAFGASRVVRGDNLELLGRACRGPRQRAVLDSAVITAPCDRSVIFALEAVRGGGRVLLFAHTHDGPELPVGLSSICRDEKDLIGSYSSDFTLQREVARIVFGRRLDVRSLITHRFPLERTGAAIELSGKPQGGALKVMISQLGEDGERHGRVRR